MESNGNTEMDEGKGERINNNDKDYEMTTFEVEEARKRKHIEYSSNATISVTAHEKEEKMVITPKEDDVKKYSSVNVETLPLPKQATDKADVIGLSKEEQITINKIVNIVEPKENKKMDKDYEMTTFEVEETRKRKHIEYSSNATIPVTAHEKEEKMVITPKEDDVKKYSSVNVETLPLPKQATDKADVIGLSKEEQITINKIVNIVEPKENKKMDKDYEMTTFEVEETRKRKHIEYSSNATIPVTAHEKEEKMVITPKEDDKIVNIVEPKKNKNMDEDYETSSFEDIATSESDDDEEVMKKSEEDLITITVQKYPCKSCKWSFSTEKKLHDHIRNFHVEKPTMLTDVESVCSVNVGTLPLSKPATDKANANGPSKKEQIAIKVQKYPCKSCKWSFSTEKRLHDHIRIFHVEKSTMLTDKIVKIVEPNENTKMDEGVERRNSNEDYEISSFEVEEARKRRRIENSSNATIPITTPKEDDVKKVSSIVNVETLPLSKQATDEANVITQSKVNSYPCKSCIKSFKSDKALQQHIRDKHEDKTCKSISTSSPIIIS
ncbi:uncharacterized protein LOC124937548 [Impatiens glandulifera]|uniref:uncharacterized protein LOC124937548 n=1 Tax=Impatiens glandulifera TaxID=253017 RepID=UPI001FB08360|nr:uncharacterized protein LOC124937548 [Impatiens glandulifera]